ncbi:hypothetical protein [Agrobacterium larrymoorei]|uniref:DUF1311 domain-containing protein n=1 Tax=Agrobacterium larrymoorei TaxID=160699 RepID=A0AAF0HCE6_9HYPH|nr:hypothetical protein [Agrobacterium larrymoorei]WHA41915.1 hypothetical protein CFBP5477_004605 [Agrobacterium larrymoorei]
MTAANKVIFGAGALFSLFVISAPAEAQYFSSDGRSGFYADAFLMKVQKTSVGDNRMAAVRLSNNRGEIETRDYVVNCNRHFAQVLDDNNVNHELQPSKTPSSADKMNWELWHAVCRKEFAKVSKRGEPIASLKTLPSEIPLNFDGKSVRVTVKEADSETVMLNLVEVSVDDGKRQTAYLYCDPENSTAYWNNTHVLIGINEEMAAELNDGASASLVSLSQTIWKATCRHGLNEESISLKPAPPPETPKASVDVKSETPPPPAKQVETKLGEAEELVSGLYENYIVNKALCELSDYGDYSQRNLKAKLQKLDELAVSQRLDTKALWDRAARKMEKDSNYMLFKLYKGMPLEASDRISFSNSCTQMSSMNGAAIDSYIEKYSGKSTIQKDF